MPLPYDPTPAGQEVKKPKPGLGPTLTPAPSPGPSPTPPGMTDGAGERVGTPVNPFGSIASGGQSAAGEAIGTSGGSLWSQLVGDANQAISGATGIAPPVVQTPGGGTIGDSFRLGEEQAYFQDQFRQPGAGELGAQRFAGNVGQTGPANTQQQYSQNFQQQIGQDPGLGAYYDRAADRFSTGMNAQLASRGQYGSSRGLGALSEGLSGLEGQRAQQEADYMLQQQELGGRLANQAGESQLGWTTNLGKLGLGAGQLALGRGAQGISAASQADAGFLNQQDALYNRMLGLTGAVMPTFNDIYGNEITTDQQYLDAVQSGTLATGAARAGQATGDAADSAANKQGKIDTAASVFSLGIL